MDTASEVTIVIITTDFNSCPEDEHLAFIPRWSTKGRGEAGFPRHPDHTPYQS